jgi:hypothetical protein
MTEEFEWVYISELSTEQSAEVRGYYERYGVTDLRSVWHSMQAQSITYYDIIKAQCKGEPIDWTAE